jgi:membrane fusion protein, multidrug efflux system
MRGGGLGRRLRSPRALAGIIALVLAIIAAVSIKSRTGSSAPASGKGGGGAGHIAYPVEVAPVAARDVEYTIAAVGSVEAYEVVQVTARVPGVVERVRFTEGDRVAAGQVLVEIEPARYRLALQAARAASEKASAARAEAEAGLARREGVDSTNPGLIPGEEIEAWSTRVRTAAAEYDLNQAAADQAAMNLRDATPSAPVGGIIQTRTVQTGQYVEAGTVLATLVRRDPLLLRFKVPESDAMRLQPGLVARFQVRNAERAYHARLVHVAERAEESSRMVDVTALVEDTTLAGLLPGTFAEVTVPVGSAPHTPVVPQTAIRPSERGFLAFVVADGIAHERVLELGLRTSDGLVEVRSGLQPAESLVVRGSEALRDGAPVAVKTGATGTTAAATGNADPPSSSAASGTKPR